MDILYFALRSKCTRCHGGKAAYWHKGKGRFRGPRSCCYLTEFKVVLFLWLLKPIFSQDDDMNTHHSAPEKAPLHPAFFDDEDVVDADEFVTQSIAADLKAARKSAGLTQAQLAAKLQNSRSVIGAAERGAMEVG